MKANSAIDIKRLYEGDQSLVPAVLDCFATAFEDPENYSRNRPDPAYLSTLLAQESFIALVAMDGDSLAGALVAYDLKKLEQARSEIYIYDLAVDTAFRRRGVATSLIQALKPIAKNLGAISIYVQADPEDEEAVNLYTKLGERADVLHFDFMVVER